MLPVLAIQKKKKIVRSYRVFFNFYTDPMYAFRLKVKKHIKMYIKSLDQQRSKKNRGHARIGLTTSQNYYGFTYFWV